MNTQLEFRFDTKDETNWTEASLVFHESPDSVRLLAFVSPYTPKTEKEENQGLVFQTYFHDSPLPPYLSTCKADALVAAMDYGLTLGDIHVRYQKDAQAADLTAQPGENPRQDSGLHSEGVENPDYY